MTLHLRRTWAPLLIMAMAFGLASCNQPESGTRNIVDVIGLNENGPLLSDVYNFGDNVTDPVDDFIPVDLVKVTFQSRTHDGNLTTVRPGQPFGSVRFLSYDLTWESDNPDGADLDGNGSVDLANFKGAPMNVVVPTGQVAETYITVVSGGAKTIPPIACLGPVGDLDCGGGGCGRCANQQDVEYRAFANITFYGTEETSGDSITLTRGLLVFISQFGDKK